MRGPTLHGADALEQPSPVVLDGHDIEAVLGTHVDEAVAMLPRPTMPTVLMLRADTFEAAPTRRGEEERRACADASHEGVLREISG